MELIIAEKPSVAQGIAQVLGKASKGEGYVQAGDYTLTWCAGHLLQAAPPEAYVAGAQVSAQQLPVVPGDWLLEPRDARAGAQLKVIKALLAKADGVINAGDADREGQLLVDEVLEHLKWRGKTRRLWLSSMDEESVKRAMAALKPNADMAGLSASALARSRADWLLGFNGSIAISRSLQRVGLWGKWSVGRVQTPTLALIVDRQAAISAHAAREHYQVQAKFANGVSALWQIPEDLLEEGLLMQREFADQVAAAAPGAAQVVRLAKKPGTRAAPLPHSLAALQMEANSRFGMSAADTLAAAQALYEAKLTTYPRSDCRYVPLEMHADAPRILAAIAARGLAGAAGLPAEVDPACRHGAFDTKAVTAHHAIIPTGVAGADITLSPAQRQVFELICAAYVRLFMPAERFEEQEVVLRVQGEAPGVPGALAFRATARVVQEPGWTALGKSGDEGAGGEEAGQAPSVALPPMAEGDTLACEQASVMARRTKAPKPYNDKTLIAAMTGIHKLVTDPKLKARLKETSGLGTEATRAALIETLADRGYVERQGKDIVPTERGIQLIGMVRRAAPGLADPGETALQEDALADIAAGRLAFDRFMSSAVQAARELTGRILQCDLVDVSERTRACPACGGRCLGLTSKAGKPYHRCLDCQALFGDDAGKPGQAFEAREPGQERAVEPGAGPACPDCGIGTHAQTTSTQKPYFRCGKCRSAWWPERADTEKLGAKWQARDKTPAQGRARSGSASGKR